MRVLKQLCMMLGCLLALMLGGVSILAQDGQPEKAAPKIEQDVRVEKRTIVLSGQGPEHVPLPPGMWMGGTGPGEGFTFNFVSSEMSFDNKVVKGAPYSAVAVTETSRTLSDGNRIVHKNTATIYRDSEGRTRREQTLAAIGPFAAAGDPPQTIFINDPVQGVNYILDPRNHTARKMGFQFNFKFDGKNFGFDGKIPSLPSVAKPPYVVKPGDVIEICIKHADGKLDCHKAKPGEVMDPKLRMSAGPNTFRMTWPDSTPNKITLPTHQNQNTKTESLGTQNVEGVQAEGTRTVTTIPAGQIGNERAIEIVSERWYSPELQTVVMSKRNDPLVGETTYRLTNINRNEPSRTLFEVPADYKIADGPMIQRMMIPRKNKENK